MKNQKITNKTGFTIIEVSLVLAIAGLIFAMVFIAFPTLQRQQRDTKRKEDITYLVKEIKRYQENNNGALPNWTGSSVLDIYVNNSNSMSTAWGKFYSNYLGTDFKDPSGNNYRLGIMRCDDSSSSNITAVDVECQGYTGGNGMYSPTKLSERTFPNEYYIYIVLQATCNGDKAIKASNPRSIAAMYKLEATGVFCANT